MPAGVVNLAEGLGDVGVGGAVGGATTLAGPDAEADAAAFLARCKQRAVRLVYQRNVIRACEEMDLAGSTVQHSSAQQYQ